MMAVAQRSVAPAVCSARHAGVILPVMPVTCNAARRSRPLQQHVVAALSLRAASSAGSAGQRPSGGAIHGPKPVPGGPNPPQDAGGDSGGGDGGGRRPRRMILLRHADSEASSRLRDHDRPISAQGVREASAIARRLTAAGWVPDLIIASNSRRTRQTLDTMAEAAEELGEADAHFLGSLYTVAALDGQTKHHLEETVRAVACDAQHFCVMCVGHNKGWEEAASAFARRAVRLSTASAALFERAAGGSWEDATAPGADWTLVQVLTP